MSVCSRKVVAGQDVVGVVGGVVEEEIVDDGEEVVAQKAPLDGVVVGSNGAGVGVVDEERVDAWAVCGVGAEFGEGVAENAHVDGACEAFER